MTSSQFDPIQYKQTTRDQWEAAADAWNPWIPILEKWFGPATETMLDMAGVQAGNRVLDVAAGRGGQAISAARRVGASGYVLATDISANMLAYAAKAASSAGLSNIETRVLDGENLDVEPGTFDAVISRVGLIFFPDQHKALTSMYRALKPGGRVAAIVYSTPERNQFFSIPVSVIRRRAQLPPPLAGQPGPFSLGSAGVLEAAYQKAGYKDIAIRVMSSPLQLSSAAECVRFEREAFGALHQMLRNIESEAEREDVWREVQQQLAQFEGSNGFEGPCEFIIGVGVK